MRASSIGPALVALTALALAGCPRDRDHALGAAPSASVSAPVPPPARPPLGLDRPMPAPDAALPRVTAKGLPAMGAFTSIALAPSGASVDNAPVVGAWSEDERARVLRGLPPGSGAVLEPRRKVLGLEGWRPLEAYDAGVFEVLAPLRDALARLGLIETVHARPEGQAAAPPRLDLAVYATPTAPYDLFTSVLMVAHGAGYRDYHLAVRDDADEVRDLNVLAPAGDFEALRSSRGAYCAVPLVTMTSAGFEVAIALGAVDADIVVQPTEGDLRRLDAERAYVARYGDGAAGPSHLPPPRPAGAPGAGRPTDHVGAGPSGSAGAPQPAWARWFRRVVVRPDRACPSVPSVGRGPDVAALVALVRQVQTVAPGCRSAFLRAESTAMLGDVAPVAAAIAGVAPRLVLMAPPSRSDPPDCADAVTIAELGKATR